MRHSMQSPEESCPSSTPGRMILLQWKQTVLIHLSLRSLSPAASLFGMKEALCGSTHSSAPSVTGAHHDQLTVLIWKRLVFAFHGARGLMCLVRRPSQRVLSAGAEAGATAAVSVCSKAGAIHGTARWCNAAADKEPISA